MTLHRSNHPGSNTGVRCLVVLAETLAVGALSTFCAELDFLRFAPALSVHTLSKLPHPPAASMTSMIQATGALSAQREVAGGINASYGNIHGVCDRASAVHGRR